MFLLESSTRLYEREMGGRTNKWICKVINDIKQAIGAHIVWIDLASSK